MAILRGYVFLKGLEVFPSPPASQSEQYEGYSGIF